MKLILKIAHYIVDKNEDAKRKKYLKTTTTPIHILKGSDILCGGTVYDYEDYDWEDTPFVVIDGDEIKYATCKKCLTIYEKAKNTPKCTCGGGTVHASWCEVSKWGALRR